MKKPLAIILAILSIASAAAISGCKKEPVADDPTSAVTTHNNTTSATKLVTTTDPDPATTTVTDPSTTVTTTVPNPQSSTVTTTIPKTTTTSHIPTTPKPVEKGINGVDYDDKNNQNKVVNGVYTSSNGGIQFRAEGWRTYNLYSISIVPSTYENTGLTNGICVSVYPKGTDAYDTAEVFENKTKADFESALKTGVDSLEKTSVTSNGKTYTCYKAVVTDAYYVWVFQTPEAKYFINFMQAPLDKGGYPFESKAEAMFSTIEIYK